MILKKISFVRSPDTKLMNNSVFGKTMENQRDRAKAEIVTMADRAQKLMSKPNVSTFHIYKEDLAIFRIKKWTVHLNKPIYVGFTVLDISKMIVYQFFMMF